MLKSQTISAIILAGVCFNNAAHGQVSTSFTYQGMLMNGATAVNTAVDIRCTLFDSAAGTGQVGTPQTFTNILPVDGRFTIQLDFGQFISANRWLQIETRPAGSGGYTALAPRQMLTAAPFANFAIRSASADQFNGQAPSFYTNASNLTSGTIPDLRLSTNIPLLNSNSAYSGIPAFNGGISGSTAPFMVDSTFKVTNLNADLLDGLDSSSFASSSHTHAHSSLSGLNNDDHTQYYNQSRGDARYALLNGSPAFSLVAINSTLQTPLSITSASTGGTWNNLSNTSTGGRAWHFISAGSGNSEGAGKFLLRDSTAGAVRLAVDTAGQVGIGTSSPGAPLDVVVAPGNSLQFWLDGAVPGINVNNSGGNAGILRLRNSMEVWASDDLTRAGKIDIRDTGGNPTVTLDGASGNIAANNMAACRSVSTVRADRVTTFPGPWSTLGQGGFANLDTISVTAPANGQLIMTVTANIWSRRAIYFKIEEITGVTTQLIEQQFNYDAGATTVSASDVVQMTWTVPTGPGRRSFRTVMTNGSGSSDAYIGTTTFTIMYVPNTLAP